jgi:hypothetical protein
MEGRCWKECGTNNVFFAMFVSSKVGKSQVTQPSQENNIFATCSHPVTPTSWANVVDMPNPRLSSYRPSYQCPNCPRILYSGKGLTQHRNSAHREFTPPSDDLDDPGDEDVPYIYHLHPFLNGKHHPPTMVSFGLSQIFLAIPCDENGGNLPNPPPDPAPSANPTSWSPFRSRVDFDFAHYHFVEVQDSAANINKALDMWQASVLQYGGEVPWTHDLVTTVH